MIEIGLKANLWLAGCTGLIAIESADRVKLILSAHDENVPAIVKAVKDRFNKPTSIKRIVPKKLFDFRHLELIENRGMIR